MTSLENPVICPNFLVISKTSKPIFQNLQIWIELLCFPFQEYQSQYEAHHFTFVKPLFQMISLK